MRIYPLNGSEFKPWLTVFLSFDWKQVYALIYCIFILWMEANLNLELCFYPWTGNKFIPWFTVNLSLEWQRIYALIDCFFIFWMTTNLYLDCCVWDCVTVAFWLCIWLGEIIAWYAVYDNDLPSVLMIEWWRYPVVNGQRFTITVDNKIYIYPLLNPFYIC